MAWCDVVEPRTLRECRIALGQSQSSFAAMLGVSPESYRTWDAGRRATPPKILARARALATHRDEQALLPLPVLALLIGCTSRRYGRRLSKMSDHPRACGELFHLIEAAIVRGGSSPRMRGTPPPSDIDGLAPRIIPAHAGNSTG